jgi:hypothetical protein
MEDIMLERPRFRFERLQRVKLSAHPVLCDTPRLTLAERVVL